MSDNDEKKKWEPKYLQAVDSKWHFGKASLRPYASESGSPFYTRGMSDADHLALRNILDRLSPNTAEACNRMGVALSEAGGTINMMTDFVDRYLNDPVTCLQKLGLDHLAADMGKSKAKQLRTAAQVFDRNFAADKPKLSLAEAAAAWVDYFSTDGKEEAKSWQRLARKVFSVKCKVCSVECTV